MYTILNIFRTQKKSTKTVSSKSLKNISQKFSKIHPTSKPLKISSSPKSSPALKSKTLNFNLFFRLHALSSRQRNFIKQLTTYKILSLLRSLNLDLFLEVLPHASGRTKSCTSIRPMKKILASYLRCCHRKVKIIRRSFMN